MANWIFQYGAASLGVVIDRLSFTQVTNAPKDIIPRGTGVSVQSPKKLERKIQITGRLNGADTTGTRDAINSLQSILFNDGETEKLKLHDDRHIEAYMTNFRHDWLPGVGASAIQINATFVAPHPFFIDDASFSNTENVTVAAFSFTVINTGTAITPPRLRFVATNSVFTSVALTSNTTGQAITYTRVTSVGDEIRVDVASYTITNSAGIDMTEFLSGSFLELNNGNNFLVFTGSACDVVTEWNPRYDQ